MKLNQLLEGVFQAPADQCETFPHTIPVGSGGREDILYCDYGFGSDVWRMMGLFWLHQHHRRSAQRQNYPYRAQPWVNKQSLQNSLRKTAWDKRGTSERKGWYQQFFGDQEADSTFKYPKWHEMKMMWGRLCLCSLMGHQDLWYDGAD